MNAFQKRMLLTLALAAASLAIASTALADPLPGRDVLKFGQQPMSTPRSPTSTEHRNGLALRGHDELSTAYGFGNAATRPTPYQGRFMADDFADKLSRPRGPREMVGLVPQQFPIAQHAREQVPDFVRKRRASDRRQCFSHPGPAALEPDRHAGPAGGAPAPARYTEKLISPGGPPLNEQLYEYNAELHLGKAFFREGGHGLLAEDRGPRRSSAGHSLRRIPISHQPSSPRWGWHNRDYTIKIRSLPRLPRVIPVRHCRLHWPRRGGTNDLAFSG